MLHKSIIKGFDLINRFKPFPPNKYYTGYPQATQKELCHMTHYMEREIDPLKPYYYREYLILPDDSKLLVKSFKD